MDESTEFISELRSCGFIDSGAIQLWESFLADEPMTLDEDSEAAQLINSAYTTVIAAGGSVSRLTAKNKRSFLAALGSAFTLAGAESFTVQSGSLAGVTPSHGTIPIISKSLFSPLLKAEDFQVADNTMSAQIRFSRSDGSTSDYAFIFLI